MNASAVQLDLYRTAIPMRSFEHAAASRSLAEAVVARLELADGSVGWGETLPRDYVTGETLDSVLRDIQDRFWPALREGGETSWPQDPPAARCAVELAWQDAQARSAGLTLVGRIPRGVRVSGVLGSTDPAKTARRLRLMRWFGLRDYKLKLGLGDDADARNLQAVQRQIGRSLTTGKCTLRVDVNGGWKPDETPERAAELKAMGVCVIEQPVFGPPEMLIELAGRCPLPLMADESLRTPDDAARLIRQAGPSVWLNIRLSKNGGLGPCRQMAESAAAAGVPFVIGCMVGETSILSAAQRSLLSSCPCPRFVEGNYGRFLLADDLAAPSLRFGYGGRLKGLSGPGWGITIWPDRLARYAKLVVSLRA